MKTDAVTSNQNTTKAARQEPLTNNQGVPALESMNPSGQSRLDSRYLRCRHKSQALTLGLTPEDMMIQSMPDASPTKWHLAHTTWFFEQFVLKAYDPNYREFDPNFSYLFNSYYNNVGDRHSRELRGLLSRPSFDQVLAYRDTIDDAMIKLLEKTGHTADNNKKVTAIRNTIEVGLHHEMQHQELLLTDILHALSFNSMHPAMRPKKTEVYSPRSVSSTPSTTLNYQGFDEGIFHIGGAHSDSHDSKISRGDESRVNTLTNSFSFDCEHPRHQTYVHAFALAQRTVTNREWLEFMQDGGYSTATLWLSDGWALCQQHNWQAPLYWVPQDGSWLQFSHFGLHHIDLDAPVCHINYYEADAFASWAEARLPTEQEWEVAAGQQAIQGNFQEDEIWLPQAARGLGIQQLYGNVWEWTRSAYSPYPGYSAPAGAIGEYNGKFMSGQFVLRGGSCVTPIEQIRLSYRNFFYPHQRWQFSGLRLAKDI